MEKFMSDRGFKLVDIKKDCSKCNGSGVVGMGQNLKPAKCCHCKGAGSVDSKSWVK